MLLEYTPMKININHGENMLSNFSLSIRLCHCQKEAGRAMESRKACSEALKIDDEPRLYCDRAEAYLLEDMYDEVSSVKT